MDYRDRRIVLLVIGGAFLLLGFGAAFLGPLEMICFYFFAEGGRFAYEGFGFGSFMFGNIAAQIIGYYVIAAIAIPLGYGHLTVRRWARTLSLALLWAWLVVGLPLSLVLLLILLMSKDLTLFVALVAIGLVAAFYFIIPWLLIRFYKSRDVQLTFGQRDPEPDRLGTIPIPVLVLSALYLLGAVLLHVPIFFRGIFPLFGLFLFDLPGFLLLDFSIWACVILAWGTLRRKSWAWWGALAGVGLMIVSTTITLLAMDYHEVLAQMRFAPLEMQALQGIPARGVYVALFVGGPMVVTWIVIVCSKRHFGSTAVDDPVELRKVLQDYKPG
ncbi:MAG: hypothetical protein JXA89_05405 [Anaerolineae bacterium]|nr:hypothetical protein [Anaerolineae bacterium]